MYSIIRKIFKLKNEFLRKTFFDKNTLKLFSYKYTSYYIKKDNDDLSKLCKKYITNKGYEYINELVASVDEYSSRY